jgi:hypothetical protein
MILNFNNYITEHYEHDIRKNYQKFGVEDYYKNVKGEYVNPHFDCIEKSIKEVVENYNLDFNNVLDLAAGTGEVTTILKELNINNVIGCDPYLYKEYIEYTNSECLKYSFEDITKGVLKNYNFSTIICSYALHLADKSILNDLLWNLSLISKNLIILSPNNSPIVNENNWQLIDSFKIDKCKTRIYEKS